MKNKFIIFISIAFLICSCKETTNVLDNSNLDTNRRNVAFVLCEGLWGYDNSSISKINLTNLQVTNNFEKQTNPDFKIGDTANDLVIRGDTIYVVVTTSKVLELFDLRNGKLLSLIFFPENSAPRKLAFANDTIALVTDLYQDFVYVLNLRTRRIINQIKVGPAPEGIAVFGNKAFVVNSGFGDFRANEPKAGTLSIIDLNSYSEVNNIYIAPNPIEILVCPNTRKMYIGYYNFPSKSDSVGGIVEFDLSNFERTRQWNVPNRSIFYLSTTNEIVFISNKFVSVLNLDSGTIWNLIENPNPNEIWYSVGIDEIGKKILIGNARNYTSEGEVLIYTLDKNPALLAKLKIGVNPSKIVVLN